MEAYKLNILLIFGSPHKDGAVSRLVEAFSDGLGGGADVRCFDAYDLAAHPCIDCGACAAGDRCAFGDLEELDGALRSSDAIVIASPVYNLSFPSPLKAIVDRTQRYFRAYRRGEPVFAGHRRELVLLLAAGQRNERGAVISEQLGWLAPSLNAYISECVIACNTDREPPVAEILEKARMTGVRLSNQTASQNREE